MQLNRMEIMERLRDILLMADDRNTKLIESCTEDYKLVTDLGLSSVALLYVVIAIEETFDIRFDSVGIADFETVNDVVDFIEEKLK